MKDLLQSLAFLLLIFGLMPATMLVILQQQRADKEAEEQFYKDMQQEKPESHTTIDRIAPGRSQD